MYYPPQQQNPRDERLARVAALAHISAQQDAQDSNAQAAMIEQMKTMYGLQQDSQLAPERLRALQLENTGRDIANRTGQETLDYNPQYHAAMLHNLGLEGTGHELANANAQEMLQYNPQAHAAALAESAAATGAHTAQTHEAERRTTAIGSNADLETERGNLSRQRERILRLQELQYLEQGSGKPLTPQQREMYLQGSPYATIVAATQPRDVYGPSGAGNPTAVPTANIKNDSVFNWENSDEPTELENWWGGISDPNYYNNKTKPKKTYPTTGNVNQVPAGLLNLPFQ